MPVATEDAVRVWTADDLLQMPDDGVERWIVRGQLREKPSEFPEAGMTVRNRHHCEAMSFITATLVQWLRQQPLPRGSVYSGEAGVRLRTGSETAVGVDLMYAPPEVVASQSDDETTLVNGTPTLVVEILSPSDTQDEIEEKLDVYLEAGIPIIWTVNPRWRTVTIHHPGGEPELFNRFSTLPEHSAMPGFTPKVSELFE